MINEVVHVTKEELRSSGYVTMCYKPIIEKVGIHSEEFPSIKSPDP